MVGPRTIYGIIQVHENQSTVVARRLTDIRAEDRILADGAWYRVTESVSILNGEYKRIGVERVDKPILPETEDIDES